jgi:hypothetical protein
MFKDCNSLVELEINTNTFKTTHINDIGDIFEGCNSLINKYIYPFVNNNI